MNRFLVVIAALLNGIALPAGAWAASTEETKPEAAPFHRVESARPATRPDAEILQARIARIDAIALGALDHGDGTRLLKASTAAMRADGAQAAVALRGSWKRWRDLVAAGFVPTPTEFYFVAMPTQSDLPLAGVRRLNVVWR